jgi:hypothetical protein
LAHKPVAPSRKVGMPAVLILKSCLVVKRFEEERKADEGYITRNGVVRDQGFFA